MSLYRTLVAAALGIGLIATPALAERPRDERQAQARLQSRDQDRAFEATKQGRSMPLPNIERRVMPFRGGADYLGPELNGDTYRLKFMRDGRVIWVDVDAATGRILRRSRP
ncbi:MAG: PepSY domain-containing protein [Sphingomicrobium sp.]